MKITTHEQYRNLLGIVENLCSLTHLLPGEAEQLDKLSSDVEEYEKLHFPIVENLCSLTHLLPGEAEQLDKLIFKTLKSTKSCIFQSMTPHIVNRQRSILVEWFDGSKEVGHVEMCLDERPGESFYETHSSLDEEHRNNGYGIMMYDKCFEIAELLRVTVKSSLVPSDDALRVWNSRSLNKKWDIAYINNRYVVCGRREHT